MSKGWETIKHPADAGDIGGRNMPLSAEISICVITGSKEQAKLTYRQGKERDTQAGNFELLGHCFSGYLQFSPLEYLVSSDQLITLVSTLR